MPDQTQIDTDQGGRLENEPFFYCSILRLWQSFEEMVNPCLECLILYYQVPCLIRTSVVLQIFQSLCLADVNKAIKYKRPGNCLAQDIKSFKGILKRSNE